MKATGIVRRIDDLGRVVIPKEIRRVLRIRDGDPMEIFTNREGEVIFKKYSPVGELTPFAQQLCETMAKTTGYTVAICDRDAVIASAGPQKKALTEKKVSAELENVMKERKPHFAETRGGGVPVADGSEVKAMAAIPVIVLGDITGCALMIGGENDVCTDTERKLCQSVALFLGKQLDE
ncbi:MAG: AbrB/MazE/SpoVT family DNA-binding domain-containing protein [Clostridia bacterium]|nr:AbrB/MazE/SpoVT family DNA-binding domain-containing protein [Clostridia bacterium]